MQPQTATWDIFLWQRESSFWLKICLRVKLWGKDQEPEWKSVDWFEGLFTDEALRMKDCNTHEIVLRLHWVGLHDTEIIAKTQTYIQWIQSWKMSRRLRAKFSYASQRTVDTHTHIYTTQRQVNATMQMNPCSQITTQTGPNGFNQRSS